MYYLKAWALESDRLGQIASFLLASVSSSVSQGQYYLPQGWWWWFSKTGPVASVALSQARGVRSVAGSRHHPCCIHPTEPAPVAMIPVSQLLKPSPPTVPAFFLHQRTAPSQGGVFLSLCLANVCVWGDGRTGSRAVGCKAEGRVLVSALQQGEKFSLQPTLGCSVKIPLSVLKRSSSAELRIVSTISIVGTAVSQAGPWSCSPI